MSKVTRMAVIDLAFASEFGLNLNQGAVYNAMRFAPTYCTPKVIEGEVYYFISRNMMCEKLRLITDKPDTMYRYYKQLQSAGLILLEKVGTQDYVHIIAEHAQKWNSDDHPTLGRSSEQLGRSSENTPKNSDDHPTYIRESIKGEYKREGAPTSNSLPVVENDKAEVAPPEDADPIKKYQTAVMNDFIDPNTEKSFENILARIRQYHIDYPGTGKRVCSTARNMLTQEHYNQLLKKWIRHLSDKRDFFRNPTDRLFRGRSNFVSWVSREEVKPEEKANNQIELSGYDSPIMRERRERVAKAMSKKSLQQ